MNCELGKEVRKLPLWEILRLERSPFLVSGFLYLVSDQQKEGERRTSVQFRIVEGMNGIYIGSAFSSHQRYTIAN